MKAESKGLVVEGLQKSFGATVALKNVSFSLEKAESLALLGPSGCGKSTTLALIAGFDVPDRGRISVLGRDITNIAPARRNVGVVFQSYALFPHLTVEENIGFGLRVRKLDKAVRRRTIQDSLELVGLQNKGQRYPRELSGGEQQRVALVRALVVQPDLLLLDEPLSNLDASLRESLRGEIRRIQRELGVTTVFVTHDQREAFGIGDKVAIIFDGMIRQIDVPAALYDRPADAGIARFLGGANIIEGSVRGPGSNEGYAVTVGATTIEVPGANCAQDFRKGDSVELIVRPENLRFSGGAVGPALNALPVIVKTVEYLGGTHQVVCELDSGAVVRVVLSGADPVPAAEERTNVAWPAASSWLVPAVAAAPLEDKEPGDPLGESGVTDV